MNYLALGYSALVGEGGKPQTSEETIDKLCDRVMHSTLLEDRRAAVLGLKGLSRQYQLQVGTKAMPILLHVIHEDKVDPEVAKAILEILINLCDATTTRSDIPEQNLGIQFTEIFVKDPANVALLLSLLAETDFHVRFNDIDLLKILLKNKRKQLQDAILTSPMGVSRLMDLLDDRREVIRNEGLLLLIDLTHKNADIQKIIAFENAFERLFQIIYDEGACDGDVVVQDCLQLIFNLLSDNVSNQNYFRESGLIPRLKEFFRIQSVTQSPASPQQQKTIFLSVQVSETQPVGPWTQQKVLNVSLALDIIRVLVARESPITPSNQKVIFQCGLLYPVLQIALFRSVGAFTQSLALQTVALVIKGNLPIQDYLSSASVNDIDGKNQRSVVVEVISLMVEGSRFDYVIREGAYSVVKSFLESNPEAQRFLLSTARAPPPPNPNDPSGAVVTHSAGSLLFLSLFDWNVSLKDPFRSWFSAAVLSFILKENAKCKDIALALKLPDQDGDEMEFMEAVQHALMVSTREEVDARVIIGFFSLLASWLYNSPKGVKKYLSDGSNFSFLIEQITNVARNVVIQGLAAFVLGLCFEFNDDSIPGFSRSSIQGIVISRIGADQFVNRLNRLKEAPEFSKIIFTSEAANKNAIPDVFFTPDFQDFFKVNYETMQKSVVNPKFLKQKEMEKEETKMHENVITSYKVMISTQDQEIAKLKAELVSVRASSPSVGTAAVPVSDNDSQQQQLAELEKKLEQLDAQHQQELAALQAKHKRDLAGKSQQISAFEQTVHDLDTRCQDMQLVMASLESQLSSAKSETIEKVKVVEDKFRELETACEKAMKDRDDALVFLAEQDGEIAALKEKLKSLGHAVDEDDDETEDN